MDRRLGGMAAFARRVLSIFYREIEIVGASNMPQDGPLLVVGNHGSALLDPGLFVAFLPRPPQFLALSTLWDVPALRPLLTFGAAIPIYQRAHESKASEKNRAVFERCYEALAGGGVIGLFPEGRSHHEPALGEIKTGAARIALETLARFPDLRIPIVPVGLSFEEKTRFRSRVLIKIGEPFDPLEALAEAGFEDFDPTHSGAEPTAVRSLTAHLRSSLLSVTLNYPSWREAELIEHAVAIYERPLPEPPTEPDLAPSFPVRKLFIDGYRRLSESVPDKIGEVRREVEEYEAQLDVYGLRDEQVIAAYPPPLVLRFTARTLWHLFCHLPLGALGTLLNFLPYRVSDLMTLRSRGPETDSTYKIIAALVFYPLFWIGQGLAVAWFLSSTFPGDGGGLLTSPWWGALVTFLGPISGLYAIKLYQHADSFLRHARAFLFFHGSSRRLVELRERRQRVLASVKRLAEIYLD